MWEDCCYAIPAANINQCTKEESVANYSVRTYSAVGALQAFLTTALAQTLNTLGA
jgi:hypothetical protein